TSLGDPQPAQNPPSNALLCALNPVIGFGCNPVVPGNVHVSVAPGSPDPILQPDSNGNVVVGPFPPPTGAPGQTGLACLPTNAVCVSAGQCCSGKCNPGFCPSLPCPMRCG